MTIPAPILTSIARVTVAYVESTRQHNRVRSLAPVIRNTRSLFSRFFQSQYKLLNPPDYKLVSGRYSIQTARMLNLYAYHALGLGVHYGRLGYIQPQTLIQEARLSIPPNHPAILEYLREYSAQRISDIDSSTETRIRAVLIRAHKQSWSEQDLSSAIESLYDDFTESRARLIAQTEMSNAFEYAQLVAASEIADTGASVEKKWITMGDSKVSQPCRGNEKSGWMGYMESFSGESSMDHGQQRPPRFPGCRCTLAIRAKSSRRR